MQSVVLVLLRMAEPRRPRPVARQVAIRVEDVDDEKEHHGVEHYFMRLIWTAKLHGLFFSPKSRPFFWMANLLFNCITLVIISVAMFYEANLILDNVNTFDIEISTMLCSIVWVFQSVISMAFMIWWQLSGRLWKYFENVIVHQRGEAIYLGSNILKRTVCFSHFTNITVISIVLLVHYGPETVRSEFNKYEIFTNWFMKPLHTISIIHVCMSWNTTVFMYNILIDGCFLEAKYFNSRVKNLKCQEDSDSAYCRELLDLITCHSRIASNIRQLDKMMRIYSFVMVATAIPCTLLTLNMLAQRVNEYIDFAILGLPSLGIILAAFLGITLAPARLYEEMYKSKNYLCQNTNIWKSSGSDFAMQKHKLSLAMALSSHMEQPNLGLTILGFAVLSKPFILAIFSVMLMVLSLLIEIVPTIKEFVEDLEEDVEGELSAIINATLS